ncbi:sporulation protein YabP [Salinibacillus xinjiangensis]|uniref:Sporulation protein YabP n=1 Tax=Salinibacillus xinjiangensis TaxID=1229268 RepID=A0A6G1XAZ3_9BACI|nr:sporulation protein YabP [Salinibacillus xinjiangensis]MRG88183.1 sporulation protein YabP [Salinibacillus xinjiangensis]
MNYENNFYPSQREHQEHQVKIVNRRELEITGVKEVDSFDNEEFLLQTNLGFLVVRGENLHMKNLDVEQGLVAIKGRVYELSYIDEQQGDKAKGLFSKLFK